MKTLKSLVPHTEIPAFNVLIVVIILASVFGIGVYIFAAIRYFFQLNLATMFPFIMFVVSYISIIRYCVDYFIRGKYVSVYPVIGAFTVAVTVSTGLIPNVNNQTFAVALFIFLAITLIKNKLTHFKRSMVMIIAVLLATILLIILKYYYGYVNLNYDNPIDVWIAVFRSYRFVVLWVTFALIYVMRYMLIRKKYYEIEKKEGKGSAQISYYNELKELAKFEALQKIEAEYNVAVNSAKKSK